MRCYEKEGWFTDLKIKAESHELIKEVEDAYEEVDKAFFIYFGETLGVDFIKIAETAKLPLRLRLRKVLLAGQWIPNNKTLRLYPSTFRDQGVDTVMMRKAILYHEFGHAFDDQSISENIMKTNTASREAFAELCRVVAFSGGKTEEVTRHLLPYARYARTFLPASRINYYPSIEGQLSDASFFHYLISELGLDTFKDFYGIIPETPGKLKYFYYKLKGYSNDEINAAYRMELDHRLYNSLDFGGSTMDTLASDAKKWYRGKV